MLQLKVLKSRVQVAVWQLALWWTSVIMTRVFSVSLGICNGVYTKFGQLWHKLNWKDEVRQKKVTELSLKISRSKY